MAGGVGLQLCINNAFTVTDWCRPKAVVGCMFIMADRKGYLWMCTSVVVVNRSCDASRVSRSFTGSFVFMFYSPSNDPSIDK